MIYVAAGRPGVEERSAKPSLRRPKKREGDGPHIKAVRREPVLAAFIARVTPKTQEKPAVRPSTRL